jgi:hypothetical protein
MSGIIKVKTVKAKSLLAKPINFGKKPISVVVKDSKEADDDIPGHRRINIYHDDTVFYEMMHHMDNAQKTKTDDFLNIFYYLIVCYSKSCFKRKANWRNHDSRWHVNVPSVFDYDMANDTQSHGTLLDIQKRMFRYRAEYLFFKEHKTQYFTKELIDEFITFVDDSLKKFDNVIIKPIRLLSPVIAELLKKYCGVGGEFSTTVKKSKLINYDALNKVLES